LAVKVLKDNFEPGQRWLVYCDDRDQSAQVLSSLRKAGLPADEYHAQIAGDKEATLAHFSTLGGVLVAIKMLDEGVDIPAIDRALILASSRNPREFIQRRGRVLRVAPGKYFAEIHDALVMPPPGDEEPEDVAILKGELARAAQFAASANNEAVKFQLRKLALDRGIDPDEMAMAGGLEDEEEL
jgi:superfamily II DNA or RNA helicase